MQLTRLTGQDVAVPVRFGGDASPRHGLLLRFGPMEPDGTVPGHLVATTGQGHPAARRAIVWDPVQQGFGWANQHEAERLAEQLDPITALAGLVARGVMGLSQAAMDFMGSMLRPQFFLVGGIGAVLAGYLLYYWLWVVLARTLLVWLLLPGLAVLVACACVHTQRMRRLHAALFQVAWHALDPVTYHAPR